MMHRKFAKEKHLIINIIIFLNKRNKKSENNWNHIFSLHTLMYRIRLEMKCINETQV